MRFDTSQHMKLGQHMKLAPRMIQSMEILQMPLLQLEERIAQELESNATLETVEASDMDMVLSRAESADYAERNGVSQDGQPMSIDGGSGKDDFERLESFESDLPEAAANEFDERPPDRRDDLPWERPHDSGVSGDGGGGSDAKSEAMANTAARAGTIQDQLREQWRLSGVEPALIPLGETIISYIEDDGYLRTPLETIADRLPSSVEKPPPEQLERALQAVQLLIEPPGIGARDLKECLLLQIDALEAQESVVPSEDGVTWATVRRLVESHLDDLAQNRLPKIVEKTGLTLSQLKHAIEMMRQLSVAPGRQLVNETSPAIVPDAIIEYDSDADKYIAYLNDTRLPNLRINQEYAKLAKDRQAPRETRDFLKKNLSNASWLIDAVDQRRNTLLRVIKVIVDAQRDYFDYGPQALKPLPMTQVADQLGIHVATVSRAVADKYVMTPRGAVPLRGFFMGGTQTESGEDVSWDAVKAALKEVIDAEDKSNPLSDDALADEVGKRGIEIARRTVAKYRGQLGIPSARLRKQF